MLKVEHKIMQSVYKANNSFKSNYHYAKINNLKEKKYY